MDDELVPRRLDDTTVSSRRGGSFVPDWHVSAAQLRASSGRVPGTFFSTVPRPASRPRPERSEPALAPAGVYVLAFLVFVLGLVWAHGRAPWPGSSLAAVEAVPVRAPAAARTLVMPANAAAAYPPARAPAPSAP